MNHDIKGLNLSIFLFKHPRTNTIKIFLNFNIITQKLDEYRIWVLHNPLTH